VQIGVIEGDLYTDYDAQRIEKKGVRVKQINTIGACHLDAIMIMKALPELGLSGLELLVIENVGNLVCPAEFYLGEDIKVVVMSTTEGNDKVLKYPLIFREADVIVLNKLDLLPYTDFDLDRFKKDVARVNVLAPVFTVSGKSGYGIQDWCEWLLEEVRSKKLKSTE
jgi:hydrogenase nickel incorporation protein HypB